MQGIAFSDPYMAQQIISIAFKHGLIIETAGSKDEVIKLFPPLTIDKDGLERGLSILELSINEFIHSRETV